jgi:hypothetical protein
MLKHRIRRLEVLVTDYAYRHGPKPPPRQLQTAQDLIDLLQEQVEAVRSETWAGTLEKARVIGYLAGIARRTLETSTLAARLEILELVLKQRKGESP